MGATREDVISRLREVQGGQQPSESRNEQQTQAQVTSEREERQRGGAATEENQQGVRETIQPVLNLAADFNTGLANLAGVFGTADELLQSSLGVEDPDSFLPTIEGLRETGSDIGATRPPGLEASSVPGRFAEELGAGAIPFLGVAARSGLPLLRVAGAELTSAAGATGGGLALENSPAFEANPFLGRATGEILGGLSALSLVEGLAKAPKTATGAAVRGSRAAGRRFTDTFRGRGAERRAATRSQEVTLSPELSAQRISRPTNVDLEAGIETPSTLAGDPGLSRITASVMAQDPESAERLARTFSEEATSLRGLAFGRGDPDAVRNFLDLKLKEAGLKLDASVKRAAGEGATPSEASSRARKILEDSYDQARAAERRMWRNTPDDVVVQASSAKTEWGNILRETTTETGRRRLPSVLKREFGRIDEETGRLTGGSLPENPSAKQIHELYSELGDMVRSESQKAGGSASTIRTLSNVRKRLMDDLMSVDGGDQYRKAVNVSRNLNDRFTKGTVGNILGFSKAGAGSPTTETLDTILRSSGEGRANAIRDILRASPQTRAQVEDFMRDVFVQKSVDTNKNIVNSNAARKFLKDNRAALDEFPELRKELSDAIENQDVVDILVGKSNVGDMSLHQKQKTGAAVFMNANPGEEARNIINARKDRARLTKELVDTVSEDTSGDALQGLKSSFVESMFDSAGTSNALDEFTQTNFVNGTRLKEVINDVSGDLIEGGLFNQEEITRLNTIADRLANIQRTVSSRQAPGGIISDTPNQILSTIAQVGGAQVGRGVAGATGGGTVQTPGIFSSRAKRAIERLTNDEARNILVRAVRDKDVMKDLLKNPQRLTDTEQVELLDRLVLPFRDTAEILPSAAARPAATVGQESESQQERESVVSRLRELQGGGQ